MPTTTSISEHGNCFSEKPVRANERKSVGIKNRNLKSFPDLRRQDGSVLLDRYVGRQVGRQVRIKVGEYVSMQQGSVYVARMQMGSQVCKYVVGKCLCGHKCRQEGKHFRRYVSMQQVSVHVDKYVDRQVSMNVGT